LTEHQRVIAGRYEVGHLIGRGGMADVYEGVDTRLGRTVAIKLLKSDLANDPSFEARFRQEAQASARMAHPTIVRVYDAGEEETTDINGNPHKFPFIIMEYVKGQLLRDLLHERRLTLQETLDIASGVLTALEFSHRAGVVHRDIKSANIMLNEAGQVKVMDFGIARAVSDSSATMAHTSGIVGTAQYFSPEQAKGETVDARTDLYSTGVLLYEMLCGRPPFKGETAVSVAYQHVSEAVIPPSQFDPSVSPELDQVVLRALAKDREERFQSAEEFRENLLAAANGSPATIAAPVISAPETPIAEEPVVEPEVAPEPEAIAAEVPDVAEASVLENSYADDDFEALLGEFASDKTAVMPTAPEPERAAAPAPAPVSAMASASGPSTNPFDTLGVTIPANTGSTPAPLFAEVKRPSNGMLWGISSGVGVVLIGLLIWLFSISSTPVPIPTDVGTKVADVSNLTYDVGYSTLTDQGLIVTKMSETSDTVPVDTIIRTDPPAGTNVPANTVITVYVSSGKNTVKVPALSTMTEAEAAAALAAVKLELGSITQAHSATVPAGIVIESDPALNSQVPEGTIVNLIVSDGKVMVPDVTGLGIAEARSAMSAPDVGLPSTIGTMEPCTGTKGTTVIGQSIPAGVAPQGTPITLYVECLAAQ
jgi:serine/threonine protein kinase/beta-lactam-binding protein with PASTA domain